MNETMNNEVMVQDNNTELEVAEANDGGMTVGQGVTVGLFGMACAAGGYFLGKGIEKGVKWFMNRKKDPEPEKPVDVRSIIADLVAKGLINQDSKISVNDNGEIIVEAKEVTDENTAKTE